LNGLCGLIGMDFYPTRMPTAKFATEPMETLDQTIATALQKYKEAVVRLAEVPGYGPDSAQQVIAEVGPAAATFPSAAELASWVGCCPGREESAEVSKSNRSPKGNRQMRRVLTKVAHAAVKTKGSVFQALFRRWMPRLGYNKAMWAVAHRLCRLTWKILHQGVRYKSGDSFPIPSWSERARTNWCGNSENWAMRCN
jgi:transposase